MKPIIVRVSDASGGAKSSAPAVLDYYGSAYVSIQAVVQGTATYTIQQTLDNPLAEGANPVWFDHPDSSFVAQTVNRQGAYPFLPLAVRVRQTAGTGSVTLTVLQAGVRH